MMSKELINIMSALLQRAFYGHPVDIQWIPMLHQLGSSQVAVTLRTSIQHSNGNCVLQSRVRSCPSSRPTNLFAQKENCRAVTASASRKSSSVMASPTARTSPTRTPAVSVATYYTHLC